MSHSGVNPFMATIKHILDAQGSKNPHTGEPLTEAMLLGISGGLGAGYILWEFQKHASAIIVMGFGYRWNYPVEVMTQLCQRLNLVTTFTETAGKKQAEDHFQAALATGKPFIAWVDKAHMPYLQLPEELKGYGWHVVTVLGENAQGVQVADLSDPIYTVPKAIFVSARAQIPSDKNRLLQLTPNGSIDLVAGIKAGIADCIHHLSQPSESFSLPVLKKWAKLMTHPKDKKSWLNVFKERIGLYTTLRSVYEGIMLDSGGSLRQMYADFLVQSEAILKHPALNEAAVGYKQAAEAWCELANVALPDAVPAFKETKHLLQERYRLTAANDMTGLAPVMARLREMETTYNGAGFPLDDTGITELFSAIEHGLNAVYDAEVAALVTLKAAQL
jgi:hypothetical protein